MIYKGSKPFFSVVLLIPTFSIQIRKINQHVINLPIITTNSLLILQSNNIIYFFDLHIEDIFNVITFK